MKNITQVALITSLVSGFAFTQAAQADTIFGVYAGAGTWQTDYSGNLGNPSIGLNQLGTDKNNNSYFYIALEHPIPLIPNIKLMHSNINSDQTAIINSNFSLGGNEFLAGSEVSTRFDLSSTDATIYYEVLDNWLNLDLGLTLRKYNGYLQASTDTMASNVDVNETVPMAYGKFQIDLPFSGFSVGAEGNYLNYNKADISDYKANISYLFDSVLDLGMELGYRSMSVKFDDHALQTDIQMTGPYAALIAHF